MRRTLGALLLPSEPLPVHSSSCLRRRRHTHVDATGSRLSRAHPAGCPRRDCLHQFAPAETLPGSGGLVEQGGGGLAAVSSLRAAPLQACAAAQLPALCTSLPCRSHNCLLPAPPFLPWAICSTSEPTHRLPEHLWNSGAFITLARSPAALQSFVDGLLPLAASPDQPQAIWLLRRQGGAAGSAPRCLLPAGAAGSAGPLLPTRLPLPPLACPA